MTQWTLQVPDELDGTLREYLESHGMGTNEVSEFVREAVSAELFRRAVYEIREAHKDLTAEAAEELVNEAVAWARANPS